MAFHSQQHGVGQQGTLPFIYQLLSTTKLSIQSMLRCVSWRICTSGSLLTNHLSICGRGAWQTSSLTPWTDVCAVCEDFWTQLKDATREEEKVKLTAAFTTHLEAAQEERDYYLTSMKQAATTLADNRDIPLEYAHYTTHTRHVLEQAVATSKRGWL